MRKATGALTAHRGAKNHSAGGATLANHAKNDPGQLRETTLQPALPRTAHLPELCLLIISKRIGKGQFVRRRQETQPYKVRRCESISGLQSAAGNPAEWKRRMVFAGTKRRRSSTSAAGNW